ncbi:hypothetical protein V9T40_010799 [Parthenolecanium corni]|uniref:Major facilitator superfamily (MFS) profile domain-containing protein n=1 Tax=Parthenolecanium corni TaxID=536013 RepID=A0AAN9T496_9HEMI
MLWGKPPPHKALAAAEDSLTLDSRCFKAPLFNLNNTLANIVDKCSTLRLKERSVLWLMLFSGVVVHMMSSSNMNIAINSMINYSATDQSKPFIPACRVNSSFSEAAEVPRKPGEFRWNSSQKHTLLSSWAWFMGLAQLAGGLLCQKYGGKMVFGYSNLIIGLANFLIPTAARIDIYALIALRAVQGMAGGAGIGNAINFFMSRWVPPHERGKFAATMSGLFFGAAFSYFLNGFVEHLLGWRYIFYTSGVITLIWSVLWYLIVYDSPKEHPHISDSELSLIQSSLGNHVTEKKLPIPWAAILTSVPLAVNTLCHFSSMWTTMTFMIYIPMYLTCVFGFPSYRVGELSSMPYLLEGCFSLIFALITDYVMKRKILPITCTRKLATFLNTFVAAVLFGSISLCGCNSVVILVLLNIAVMVSGAALSGIAPNVVDLSPNFCAVIHGFQGLISSTAGILSPALVNHLTDKNKNDPSSWNKVFLTTSTISIICGTLFLIFGDSQVQLWNSEREKNKEVSKNLLKDDQKVVEVKPKTPMV